ncbi:hypothetical protein [Hymenobacter arizonensis]|uniref:Uncharacterized protein n=1 Tax=Hymenobacter arizonensis TaxID=1227077 RepID=A0A1I6BGA1_HYMAR|nr:hypothetical protein [Hymenobacter arizonensis]SFQ79965.1 hypothetical protein SAMN04515668_4521 [Hymenobacter arizonensis]
MPAVFPSIWGSPHFLDHSTGLQVPLGSAGIGEVKSISFDSAGYGLLSGKPGLVTTWMGTLNIPLLQPLTQPIALMLDLRFFVLQAKGGYVRVRFSAHGAKEVQDFRDQNPPEMGQNGFMRVLRIALPVGSTHFDCRFDIALNRPDTQQQTQVNLDTVDIGLAV